MAVLEMSTLSPLYRVESPELTFMEMLPENVQKMRASIRSPLLAFLDANNLVVAGGALRDVCRGVPIKDVDVYCASKVQANCLAYDWATSQGATFILKPHHYETSDGVDFVFGWGYNMQDVLEGFDFTCNMLAIQGQTGLEHPKARLHIASQEIYCPRPDHHTLSANRIARLQSKGFTVMNPITLLTGVPGYNN